MEWNESIYLLGQSNFMHTDYIDWIAKILVPVVVVGLTAYLTIRNEFRKNLWTREIEQDKAREAFRLAFATKRAEAYGALFLLTDEWSHYSEAKRQEYREKWSIWY